MSGAETEMHVPNFGKRCTLGPHVDYSHEVRLERGQVLFFVQRQLALLRYFADFARLLLHLTERLGEILRQWLGLLALLLEDEAAQDRRALLWRKISEETLEEELAEHKFVTCAELASHPGLERDDVLLVQELQAA